MYGASWCPDVRRSRALLDRAGVPYRYLDIDQDKAAAKQVRKLQRGRRRTPTIVWPDGSYLVEPSDEQLSCRLASAPPSSTAE